MANIVAYSALIGFPFFVIVLFRTLSVQSALIWSILTGYLYLPSGLGFDAPLLPTWDKTFAPSFSAAVLCFATNRFGFAQRNARMQLYRLQNTRSTVPDLAEQGPDDFSISGRKPAKRISRMFYLLMIVLFVTPVLTVFLNGEKILAGNRYIVGLDSYDLFSFQSTLVATVLPLILGRWILRTTESHRILLRALCVSGLFYSLLMLVEVRLSPQLSNWIYGYFPHSFSQHIRNGGFRPIVFLQHGLWVGIFTAMASVAALSLWRNESRRGLSAVWFFAACWLVFVLYLAKTLGAMTIAILLIPTLLFFKVRGQMLIAAIIAATILVYPMLRSAGLVPIETIYEIAYSVDTERAASLRYRLDNEDDLLQKVEEKPFFGWGGWGRSLIYDSETGKSVSIAEGTWIIFIGTFGWFGYVSHMGLVTMPVIALALRRRKLRIGYATSGLCIILVANLIDLIPNATLTPVTYLVAGALMGWLENSLVLAHKAEKA